MSPHTCEHTYAHVHTHSHTQKEWDQINKVNESGNTKLMVQGDKGVEEATMKFICQEIGYPKKNSPTKQKPHRSLRS